MRLIDADKLLASVKKNAPYIYHILLPIVALVHTEDAEPVRYGKWIHDINNLYGCSECLSRETMSHRHMKKYCPRCGTRMDGDHQ